MSVSLTRPSPAKINLTLRITGKRPDGFHDLDSIFAPLELADTLEVDASHLSPGKGLLRVQLQCSDPSLPVNEENLAVRAAHAFAAQHPIQGELRIALEKAIPHGAGLGGGSSNAATVLLALNELCQAGLDEPALVQIAASLGSDVPFFLRSAPTRCRGRGEILGETVSLPDLELLLVKPPFPIPTPWAYQNYARMRTAGQLANEPQQLDWGELINDLEPPVHAKYLVLAELKAWWLAQPEVAGALMSGSGSTSFAILKPGAVVKDLRKRTLDYFGPDWWSWSGSIRN